MGPIYTIAVVPETDYKISYLLKGKNRNMELRTEFSWPRAIHRGYIWQDLTVRESLTAKAHDNVRVLTFPTPTGDIVSDRIFPLSINTALLWRLARTELNEESINSFANGFGLLTGSWLGSQKKGGKIFWGDPFDKWVEEISWASLAVDIWDAIQAKDLDTLSRWIKWVPSKNSIRFVWKQGILKESSILASPEYHPEILALCEEDDPITPARIAVARIVNRKLHNLVSPHVLWSAENEGLELSLVPENLLGAMWLQFSEIIDRRKIIVSCDVCGERFEQNRKDKRHCSDACRVRAMRIRRDAKK